MAKKEYRILVKAAGIPSIEQAMSKEKAEKRAEGFRRGGYKDVIVQEREVSEWKAA